MFSSRVAGFVNYIRSHASSCELNTNRKSVLFYAVRTKLLAKLDQGDSGRKHGVNN